MPTKQIILAILLIILPFNLITSKPNPQSAADLLANVGIDISGEEPANLEAPQPSDLGAIADSELANTLGVGESNEEDQTSSSNVNDDDYAELDYTTELISVEGEEDDNSSNSLENQIDSGNNELLAGLGLNIDSSETSEDSTEGELPEASELPNQVDEKTSVDDSEIIIEPKSDDVVDDEGEVEDKASDDDDNVEADSSDSTSEEDEEDSESPDENTDSTEDSEESTEESPEDSSEETSEESSEEGENDSSSSDSEENADASSSFGLKCNVLFSFVALIVFR